MRGALSIAAAAALLLAGCAAEEPSTAADAPPEASPAQDGPAPGDPDAEFHTVEHDQFNAPWALEFLPGTEPLLVTERIGTLKLRSQDSGEVEEISGAPEVVDAGQGGMHDVIAGPTFDQDQTIYLSWVRSADGGTQGVVGRGQLDVDQAKLENLNVIWEQDPASGNGHFSLRMIVLEDLLYVTSGDRQELEPAQDQSTNLGTILRLTPQGEPAAGNPFTGDGGTAEQFWSTGHRNPLGIAADSQGNLWSSEMGPEGGDELNLILKGANYGWPEASMGVQYDGTAIADHTEGDGFEAPKAHWVPAISPSNLMIYQGDLFTEWRDSALLGGLSGHNLVRVELDGESAEPVEQWDFGDRIRAVEESPSGAIWIATDGGKLMELRPGQ